MYDGTVKFLIDNVITGYNCCVFAYGATGAGKTYTMMGTLESPGIMSLTLKDLFAKISHQRTQSETFDVKLSYLEIYNENIRDLLSGKQDFLDLRQDATKGVVVAGITCVKAKSPSEVLAYLEKGNKNRSCEATGANQVSSRSHAIMQVFISYKSIDTSGKTSLRISKLSMIDLAGSERAADTQNKGLRMIEGANINRSLLALGNCINSLVDPSKRKQYVNYRDSKLTRLLKDSLGGNCKTVMIANISPAASHFDETINTLKYASRAITIKAQVTQQATIRDEDYEQALLEFRAPKQIAKEEQETARKPPFFLKKQNSAVNSEKAATAAEPACDSSSGSQTTAKRQLDELFSRQLELKMTLLDQEESEADTIRSITQATDRISQLEQEIQSTNDHKLVKKFKSTIQSEQAHVTTLTIAQKTGDLARSKTAKKMTEIDVKIRDFKPVP